jgi:glyoxylase-like metal-dependent hydrolase (beta-lactamase superfamily II)
MKAPFNIDDLPTGFAEQVEPLVLRVLAGNPSPYTYSGTQTYVVGSAVDCAIIDPGPADAAHIDAIIAAVGARDIVSITCTHTHRDHSPAAAPLAQRTGAPIIGCAPLVIADDGPRADEAFDTSYAPDRILADGETIGGQGWTLQAVTTPGHTSNHICYALMESGAMFTGDHVMGWSTSVISPPDGDMADYMASMQKVHDRSDRIYYPAHGAPVEKPQQLVRGMMGHRKQRERQILKQLENGPRAIKAMVPDMYKGTDPRLYGAAGRSVLAHLLDLKNRAQVHEEGDIWSLAQDAT